MKKIETIKPTKIFNNIIKNGNKVISSYFIICSQTNDEQEKSLFGVAVGTKVGNAVTRNHIKRQIRKIIDNNKKLFQKNTIYIIIGKKECLNATFVSMNETMYNILSRGDKNEK